MRDIKPEAAVYKDMLGTCGKIRYGLFHGEGSGFTDIMAVDKLFVYDADTVMGFFQDLGVCPFTLGLGKLF